MKEQNVKILDELYADSNLYSHSNSTFSPPSEKLEHVIRFELTTGCSWNGCTFCDGYKGTSYRVKTLDEYKEHVDKVWEKIGKRSDLAKSLERIFIGGGDALSVDTEILRKAINYAEKSFAKNTGGWFDSHYPKRIALYGRTKSIMDKGKEGLKILTKRGDSYLPRGLRLIYWGVESGSSKVLNYVNKNCSKDEILIAGDILRNLPSFREIDTSVMIIPGLGGIKFYDQHINETAEILGKIKPKFLTFMGINPTQNSLYSKKMKQEEFEGVNRPLRDMELTNQMIEMIDKIPFFRTNIGCFDCNTDQVGHNPISFGSLELNNEKHKNLLVENLRYKIKDGCLK